MGLPAKKKPRHPLVGLTDMQSKAIEGLVRGLTGTQACRYAGYVEPSNVYYRLMRTENFVVALKTRREALINGSLATKALGVLEHIMDDVTAAPSARFNAARHILDLAGHSVSTEHSLDKNLDEMSVDELGHAITSGMQALTELAGSLEGSHVIDGKVREVIDVPVEPNVDDMLS